MSYLPELRSSLVQAARRTYADAEEPIAPRRRLIGRGLATALAAAVAVAVAVVAVVALGHRQPGGQRGSTAAPTRSQLREAAHELLGQVTLPRGAVVSALVPGELRSAREELPIPNRVDVYRVWRLPESPGRVIAFIVAHRPPGSSAGIGMANGSGGPGGQITFQETIVIGLAGTPAGIWRQLALDAISLRGGGTALRVDSQAGWLMPRPAGDRIPSGVARVVATVVGRNPYRHSSLVIAHRAQINSLVSLFNSLPSARLGSGMCKSAPYGLVRFVFEGRQRGAPLAVAVWTPPCRNLGLTIGARPSVPLMAGSPTMPAGAQIALVLARLFPPRRSTGSYSLNSTARCARLTSRTSAKSPLAPGAGVGSCVSESRSTKIASSR